MAFIRGNSRCIIEIDGELVRKTAPDRADSLRLQQQIRKQVEFASYNHLDFFSAPEVVREQTIGERYSAEMRYVNSIDFVEFIKNASRDQLLRTAKRIYRLIEQSIAQSKPQVVPHALLREKITSIASIVGPHIATWFDALPKDDLHIAVGICHGDLTLSNILFTHDGFALIDFLDTFIETPLQDMVKVRQDTHFLWSLQLYRQEYDPVRTSLAMTFLDKTFEEMFAKHDFYRRHYSVFQFVNLARILPYCHTNEALRTFVERCLQELLKRHV